MQAVRLLLRFLILAYLEAKKEPLRITPISVYLFWNSFGLGFSAIFMGSKIAEGDWWSAWRRSYPINLSRRDT